MRKIFVCLLLLSCSLQAEELLLYYSSRCPYSKKVLRYLHHEHRSIPMKDISQDSKAKQEFMKLEGPKVIPCLLIDHKPLYDADQIIDWLSQNQKVNL